MSRVFVSVVVLVAMLVTTSAVAQTDDKPAKTAPLRIQQAEGQPAVRVMQLGGQGGVMMASPGAMYGSLPGYTQLRQPHVQKELELVDEQKEKLQKIAADYAKTMRQDWAGYRDKSPEERQKMMADYREKQKKQTELIRKQVEKVLLPQQLDTLKEVDFRARARNLLMNQWMTGRLELTEKQKKKLSENREQLQEKIRQLQRESLDKSLKLLTPEQMKKLREMPQGGYRPSYGSIAASSSMGKPTTFDSLPSTT